jgi:DNA (cytosine-5)-methyltransferase 1
VANTNIKRRAEHSQLRQEEVGRNNSDITEAAWGGTVGDSALEYPGGIRRERGQEACRGDINDWQASGRQEDTYGISVSGSHWSGCGWVDCRDGKARPVESGSFPLANGIPGRVGRLRAYGNAIVPQVAAEFIAAYLNGAA